MEDWWIDIDDDVLACLATNACRTPAEIGERLGMSEASASSLLAMLALAGRVRIARVEFVGPRGLPPRPAAAVAEMSRSLHGQATRPAYAQARHV